MSESITSLNVGDTFRANNAEFRVAWKGFNDSRVKLEYRAGDHWLEGHALKETDVLRHLAIYGGKLIGQSEVAERPVEVAERPVEVKRPKGGISELQKAVLNALEGGALTTSGVAKLISKPIAAANSALNALKTRALVTVTETGEGLKWSKAA